MSQTITVFSPAKVNLHLAIGPRREDGYHDARSIMQALSLHDVVSLRAEEGQPGAGLTVDVTCAVHEGVAPLDIPAEKNIAYKAVMRLADALGRAADEHIAIHIEKHIPHAAGMGGGSSNAAAAMLGACRLWDVDPADPLVAKVASSIGADVPFFLFGGCVCLGDKGDVFERSLVSAKGTVVLVKLDEGVSTKDAYGAFDANPQPVPELFAQQAATAEDAADVSLFNNLAPASEAVLPELAEVRAWLASQPGVAKDPRTGEPRVLLSGSGSASFAIMEEGPDALKAACAMVSAAKLKGWWARSCSFSPAGARVIEKSGKPGARTNLGAVHKSW